jgi:RNA polymerase sigma factor (sigma-70 family)
MVWPGSEEIVDAWVAAAVGGSELDRERVLSCLTPRVRAMVVARLAPAPSQFHVVDDLVQQALVDVSGKLSELRVPTFVGLRAFASVIVARRVADYLREIATPGAMTLRLSAADSSIVEWLSRALPASGHSPRSSAARAEEAERVLLELGRLKEAYRDVLTMAFFDQLTLDEIAERMGVSRSAASMTVVRALQALRARVAGSIGSWSPHAFGT